MQTGVPPNNPEAECFVIGAIMYPEGGADALDECLRIGLIWQHFYNTANREIIKIMVSVHNNGKPINYLSIAEEADKRKILRKTEKHLPPCEGVTPNNLTAYLIHLFESTPTPKNATYYAHIVMEEAEKRAYGRLGEFAWKDNSSIEELRRRAEKISQGRPKQRKLNEPGSEAEKLPSPIEFDLKELAPPPGFLRDYMAYMTPLSEAPDHYHLFTALVLLATAIEKRIYYEVADQRKYLTLWIVLIGPSGCKKSTSINGGRRVVMDSDMQDSLLPTQFTTEILIPTLAKNPVGTFFWPEWGATMDQWSKSYSQDIMGTLTSLFDDRYLTRWLKTEKYEIDGASLNLLCGCTYSWLKKTLKQSDVAMGFWPRFLFVPARKRKKYLAITPKGDEATRGKLMETLKAIRESVSTEYPQEAEFNAVAAMYTAWYDGVNKEADDSGDESHISFIARLTDYAKKLAILVEMSRSDRDKNITAVSISPESMEYAIGLVEWLSVTARHTIMQATQSAITETEEKVLDYIKQGGRQGRLRSEITQKFRRYEKLDITRALINLGNAELVRTSEANPRNRGRTGMRYFPVEDES